MVDHNLTISRVTNYTLSCHQFLEKIEQLFKITFLEKGML